MTISGSYTFFSEGPNSLSLSLTDANGVGLSNTSVVVASLYWGRDRLNPNVTPGVVVANFDAINCAYNVNSQTFVGSIPGTFNTPIGGDYTLVVDAEDSSQNSLGHWERRAVVVVSGP